MLELPKEFIAKYRRLLGKEADDFLASFQMEADNGFRLNPLKDLRQFSSLKGKPRFLGIGKMAVMGKFLVNQQLF